MGCGVSSSKSSIGTVRSDDSSTDASYSKLKKRFGHPSYYKSDGYDLGIRVKDKEKVQSVFVATAKSGGSKMISIEYHLKEFPEAEVIESVTRLSKLSHPGIPKLIELFITDISVYAITEYVDTMRLRNFFDWRNGTTTLTHADTRQIFKSLLDITKYCHDHRIVVRNLTPGNIAIKKGSTIANPTKTTGEENTEGTNTARRNTSIFEVKVADFTQCVPFGSIKILCDHPLFDWKDVPYMAPEALLGHPYNESMDVWSLGVLLFVMVSGSLPFYHDDDQELIHRIKFASFHYDSEAWKTIPEDVKQLISSMLVAAPSQRATIADIMLNPWLSSNNNNNV